MKRSYKLIIFLQKDDDRKSMTQKLLYFCIPLFLTGCIGSIITGQKGYFDEGYPDIRTVPERQKALASRGVHNGEEKVSRATDLKQLEQDWAKIKARDAALREEAFSLQKNLKQGPIHDGKGDTSESVGPDKAVQ